MILLICEDRPAGQNNHPTHFIKGEQLFILTAIDLITVLINEMFENPRSKIISVPLCTRLHPFIFCIYEVSYPFGSSFIQERYQTR